MHTRYFDSYYGSRERNIGEHGGGDSDGDGDGDDFDDVHVGCTHRDVVEVFDIGGATVYAGNENQVRHRMDDIRPQVMFCLSGREGKASVMRRDINTEGSVDLHLPSLSRRIGPQWEPQTIVTVQWPDYRAPWMGRGWWERLVDDLRNVDGNVVFFCQGGHGRTGTALAILASFSRTVEGDPVEWVRDNYCQDTVESSEQLRYLEDLGISTRAGLPESRYQHIMEREKYTIREGGGDGGGSGGEEVRIREGLSSLFPTVEVDDEGDASVEDVDDRKAWPVNDGGGGGGDRVDEHGWTVDDAGQCVICHKETTYDKEFNCFVCEKHVAG